jgi:diguanylate cyclase (GGDEF)-like protein
MTDSDLLGNAEFQALLKKYSTNLPILLKELEEKSAGVIEANWDSDLIKSFHQSVHRIAGSSSSFGYSQINAELKSLDAFLTEVMAASSPITERTNRLRKHILQTRQAFESDRPAEFSQPKPKEIEDQSIRDARANQKIYLVEDDPFQAQELAAQINVFGYSVTIFTDLENLNEKVNKDAPRAIIMDVIFPEGINAGPDAVEKIKSSQNKSVPVIFISISNSLESRLRAVRAGGEAYFTKPVDINSLIEALDQITVHENTESNRILIVDDSPEQADKTARQMEKLGMVTSIVTDPLQIMQPLFDFNPNLILLDLFMPACNGVELARVIRQIEKFMNTPIIYLSAADDLEKLAKDQGLNGDDFLPKSTDLETLRTTIHSRLERYRQLNTLMLRDGLTGLYNHTTIKEVLDQEISRASRQHIPLSVAMLDLDHFKHVNDTYGHPVGDRVLKSISHLLGQRLRRTDSIGRYGGEEFIVILPNTTGPTATSVMDQLRDGFSKIHFRWNDNDFITTFSCGVATYPIFVDSPSLIDAADKALYLAKARGRNRVVFIDHQQGENTITQDKEGIN